MAAIEPTTETSNFDVHLNACPFAEWAAGRDEGMRTALREIRDRSEFLRLVEALDRSRAAFLVELQSAQFVTEGGASGMPLRQFESLMFGPGAGGVHGSYACGFVSAFASLAPFVAVLH